MIRTRAAVDSWAVDDPVAFVLSTSLEPHATQRPDSLVESATRRRKERRMADYANPDVLV